MPQLTRKCNELAPTHRTPCLRCPALLGPDPERSSCLWLDVDAETLSDLHYCYGGSVRHDPVVWK